MQDSNRKYKTNFSKCLASLYVGHSRRLCTVTERQDSLVTQIAAAIPGKPIIVVVKSGTGVLMPWATCVSAILQAWYPGQMDGAAVANVLFGTDPDAKVTINPSGKLPLSFPVSASDPNPPADGNKASQYPGLNGQGKPCTVITTDWACTETYSEGVLVGYRNYDQQNINPRFPFGYGLSYTTFSFSPSTLTPSPSSVSFTSNPNQTINVSFTVKNTGTVMGAEVAELYVAKWPANVPVPEPPQQLKAFHKTAPLNPGQSEPVTLTLNMRSFAWWDVKTESWIVTPGTYEIVVGDSSRSGNPLYTDITQNTTPLIGYVTVTQ